ncbi:HAD family hydrolase [Cellvibrio sp. OA-2007]|uniref:HAD family hydrolase n=1 Tax=Cellvibrio sp. OA-2007 TaxID=529823 RepID=UPI000782AABE|nr:HAD family hydrolase [Cellvibrio sp. OA-2007]
MRPNLVIFDLYGTLIQFGVKHHPFRKVLQWARQQGRSPEPDDARTLMTCPEDPVELFAAMGIFPPAHMIAQLQKEIEQELASLALFDDVIPTLRQLSDWRIPIAICSNLAKPYGAVLEQLLPDVPLLKCLSYDVGYIKPEQEIYQWIVDRAKVDPAHCLFVGDTLLADYEGPTQFGFRARHLIRGTKRSTETIGTLTDILALKEIAC